MPVNRGHFPTLKDTLVVRMAGQRAPANDVQDDVVTPPELPPSNLQRSALPAIIDKLAVGRRKKGSSWRQLERDRLRLIAAFGTAFVTGFLSAYEVYSGKLLPAATTAIISQGQDLVWPDLLAAGAVSPRGQSSVGVSPDQAFQIADAKLNGIGTPTDDEEARYWLRAGIAGSMTNDRLRWALTQLGTLYARPSAPPTELAIARSVWELAAAQKDPVALCFLARLEEGVSGAEPNKAAALKLFKQAQAAGSCRGSEQAIERLSR